ncbi:MAG: 30S ribosomal protein S17 [Anaerobiospirillum succiniciproducens]|uniref:30S ribosomal protein S17 n=1 Tax=Anaerobiospirillum succiniciproducens TaxID=13335 RepID=UPI0004023654|nr:30S ribosomal protein S17 [Anaerobiospirillum succiniciproducens]MCI6863337.1 30S ribosomal protein S17 [Anaerobiospirillum succiniciproducens]MDO4676204.1 30S ribosomal protein S17 [Anaerobiospirillum succiniciproducens]MDY2798446.1 30S ribosomal protein S17 [Anaerobiospirillum succiniciproducens]
MSDTQNTSKVARTLRGRVVSDKMQKACVVAVERRVKHPIYGKILKRTTKFHVQDVNNEARTGDFVEIRECRPVAKTIAWTLVSVIEKAE